jgi:hypothetical protein
LNSLFDVANAAGSLLRAKLETNPSWRFDMRLLIHGGRDIVRFGPIQTALDRIHMRRGISLIIHGEAPTIRAAVDSWARAHGVGVLRYPANWSIQGPDSEARWISLMLRDSRPDIILQLRCEGSEAALHRAADQFAIPVIVVHLNRQGRLAGHRAIAGLGRRIDKVDAEAQEDRMCQRFLLLDLRAALLGKRSKRPDVVPPVVPARIDDPCGNLWIYPHTRAWIDLETFVSAATNARR